jgi:hypothetical protein
MIDMEIEMESLIYSFDELRIIVDGSSRFATGSIEVCYDLLRGDRSVGEPHLYPEILEMGPMTYWLDYDDEGPPSTYTAGPSDVMYQKIFDACEDDIVSYIERNL